MKHTSPLFGFVEFKNTKASKKASTTEVRGGINLAVALIKTVSGETITVRFSKGLIASMKQNKFFTFKLMYNELTEQIALVEDHSTNAINAQKSTSFNKGVNYSVNNKYIKFTFMPKFENIAGTKSFNYKGRYLIDNACYIFDKK